MKKSNEEQLIQNKITIAIFNVTIFIAAVTFFETIIDLPTYIQVATYLVMGIPASLYFVYLVFLPLRYKKPYPYTFLFVDDLEISPEQVEWFYNKASSSIFLMIYSVIINFSFLFLDYLEKLFSINIPVGIEIITLSLFPIIILKIVKRILKLKYADYIFKAEYADLQKKHK